jgi:hypothetical protein
MLRRITPLIFLAFLGCKQSTAPTKEQVMVTFKNESGQQVKQVTLTHENGSIKRDMINAGDEAIILFHSPGENAYHTEILLANGAILTSRGMYIEGGYRMTETIYDDSVKTEYNFYNSNLAR